MYVCQSIHGWNLTYIWMPPMAISGAQSLSVNTATYSTLPGHFESSAPVQAIVSSALVTQVHPFLSGSNRECGQLR